MNFRSCSKLSLLNHLAFGRCLTWRLDKELAREFAPVTDPPKNHRDMLKKLVESVDDRFSGGKADVHRVERSTTRSSTSSRTNSAFPIQSSRRGGKQEGRRGRPEGRRSDEGLCRGKQVPEPVIDAYVRVDRVATRAEAVKALVAIATQGEAPELRRGTGPAPTCPTTTRIRASSCMTSCSATGRAS